MLGSRARYSKQIDELGAELGPWFATDPMEAEGLSDPLFPEETVDLEATGADGKKIWKESPGWRDAEIHPLTVRWGKAIYLFRTIHASQDTRLSAGFGSDDGLKVWVNGREVISHDAARTASAAQNVADLDLQQGQNQLLIKIFNHGGGSGFYFAPGQDLLSEIWSSMESDFPRVCHWMKADLGQGNIFATICPPESRRLEKKMIARALNRLGKDGDLLSKDFNRLCEGNESPESVRWLDLYARTCWVRDELDKLNLLDLEALRRAVTDLRDVFPERYPRGDEWIERMAGYEKEFPAIRESLTREESTAHDRIDEIQAFQRECLLANPLLDFDRLLLVKRRNNRHGLPQNWQGNCALPRGEYDNEIAVLSMADVKQRAASARAFDAESPPLTTLFKPEKDEFVGDVDLHFDADRMLFSTIGSHDRWQIWEIGVDGSGLRQVTPGEHPDVDNYDACYLPDERITFGSTRCLQGVPCVTGSNQVANLCRMNADGTGIRQLCFDQDHNWCPTVLNNGRVLYSRWEYSDTPHYFSRLLFHMNPDGTGQMEYYGSNSYWPNSIFYARPIPNHASQFVAVISGHHGVPRMGELILFDPSKGRFEADGVVQRIPGHGQKVEPVIQDQLVDNSWPKFLHPYPLSDKYFLVSSKPTPDSLWGIYLVDVFDNMVPIAEVPDYALLEPVPLRKTARPPVVPDKVRLDQDKATVYLSDIYRGEGLKGVPQGTVKKLRLYEFHYGYPEMGGHKHVGIEGAWDVHRILGTVPVSEDGSALFKVPANTPIAVQPLDSEGKALQVMRSWFVGMPGEVLSCVGCHERQNTTAPVKQTLATRYEPVEIEPWYGPPRGFSFKREVQPVLDKYCVGCHDGQPRSDDREIPDLTAKPENGWNNFTQSYLALHPYVRRPGPESDYHLQHPLEFHADTSELVQMMMKNHKGVHLDSEAWDRLVTWIDLNVPDHGTWSEHRTISADYHKRRLEMRKCYANCRVDPESIPEIAKEPVEYVQPEPKPVVEIAEVECPGWPFDLAAAKERQVASGLETQRSLDLGAGVEMEFAVVPAGEFVMGMLKGPDDNRPLCRVRIDEQFWMGTTEVTNKQFQQFDPLHDNGYLDQHHKDHTTPGYPVRDPELPAMRVSWNQAVEFCKWLSEKTGAECSLPTEAQWEWACRAGTETPLAYGGLDSDFSVHGNLADLSIQLLAVTGVNPQPIANPNPYEDFLPKDSRFDDKSMLMAQVAKYQPNVWGLFDMHGNVWEWTRSAYEPYPYREDDGRNTLTGDAKRVVRGGSWRDTPKRARSAFRLPYRPYQRVFNVGFRVVCAVGGDAKKTRTAWHSGG
jgi:formylglycine-generating enzyme required for sulfatase activity